MSRARILSTALGSDGILNISDIAGLGAMAAKTTVATTDLDNSSVTPAKLSTGAPTWDTSGNTTIASPVFTDSIATINSTSTNVSQRLNLTANGTLQAQLYNDASQTILNSVTSIPLIFKTANTERMRIDSSGNVGIGTSSPVSKLNIYTTDASSKITLSDSTVGTGYGGMLYGYGVAGTGGYMEVGVVDGSAGFTKGIRVTQQATTIQFFTGSTSAGNTERMRITAAGDVGVGTTNPALGFVVEKDNGSGYVAGFRNASGSPILTIQNTGGISQIQGLNSALSATASIGLQVSGGNVGIGTSSPSFKLDVSGIGRIGNGVAQGSPNSTDITATAHTLLNGYGGNYLAFGQYSSGSGYAQWIQSAYTNPTTATYNLVLQPLGGNVGIGTSGPSYKLHISDSSDTRVALSASSYPSTWFLSLGYSGSSDFSIVQAGVAERIRIGSSGQLGIGGANYGSSGQVLTSNGSGSAPSWQSASATGTLKSVQVFESSGTWTRPAGVTKVVVEVCGGGGGGYSVATGAPNGNGGSAGGYCRKFIDVTSISSATLTIGAGGAINTGGGNSSWSDGTNTLTANGGAAGGPGNAANTPLGGTATGGNLNVQGGDGGMAKYSGYIDQMGGNGGNSFFGGGGAGAQYEQRAATPGRAYGSGGGGGSVNGYPGAAGKQGVIIVWEYS